MSAPLDIKEWRWIQAITAIESRNQVVILGQRSPSDPCSLYTFQNNLDGELVKRLVDAPCQHAFYDVITVVQKKKELLALSCEKCRDIRLVDMETKQVTPIFKSTNSPMSGICSGPDGGLFVKCENIQQLDRSFKVINTFDCSYWVASICYLPAPHNTLIVSQGTKLTAVSIPDGHQVWSQKYKGLVTTRLVFCPKQDVLLASDWDKPQVHVVNPSDGFIIQTIKIPNIYSIHRMCLCNDQIVMLQQPEMGSKRYLLSYYSLNNPPRIIAREFVFFYILFILLFLFKRIF